MSSAPLAPPDIEAALVALLPGPCSTNVPNPRPSAFTVISAAGGDSVTLVQSRLRVLVECWADDETSALTRARSAWAALWAAERSFIAPDVWVTRVGLSAPANFPDPSSGQARYTFTAQITTSHTEVS